MFPLFLLLSGCGTVDSDGDGHDDGSDCDDTIAAVHPGATERCDGLDTDCNGIVDDVLEGVALFADADGDGHGDPGAPVLACGESEAVVLDGTDCDDSDGQVHPGAPETCDGTDDDCDERIDEDATDATPWFADFDGDGLGSAESAVLSCTPPDDHVSSDGDCNDSDPAIGDVEEACDGVDSDCDGLIDEDPVDGMAVAPDRDGDGYGDETSVVTACGPGPGEVTNALDCDDSDPAVHPDAVELCSGVGIDEDCDGLVDDADSDVLDNSRWWSDADGDGYGDEEATPTFACTGQSDEVARAGDCDDADPTVNPGETEVCNDGVDNDCGGTANNCRREGSLDIATEAQARLDGAAEDDKAGLGLALFDWDADGLAEAFVSAPYTGSGNAGTVYVVSGTPTSTTLDVAASAELTGTSGDAVGLGLANAGDVDGDGYRDLLVATRPQVWLVRGSVTGSASLATATATFVTEPSSQDIAVSALGDLDGDGAAEFAIGFPDGESNTGTPGAVWLISGPVTGDHDLADHTGTTLYGEAHGDDAGFSVSGDCDTDGDGSGDLAVGAPGADYDPSHRGAAYLFGDAGGISSDSLADADASIRAESDARYLGWVLDCRGDMNADGYDDLWVGAPRDSDRAQDSGAGHLFLGPLGTGDRDSTTADASWYGAGSQTYSGGSLAHAGDVDGDGYGDMIYGHGYGSSNSASEISQVVYGPLSGVYMPGAAGTYVSGYVSFSAESSSDSTGYALAAGGDVNGDGLSDFLFGAPERHGSDDDSGAAYVIFGQGL